MKNDMSSDIQGEEAVVCYPYVLKEGNVITLNFVFFQTYAC